MRTSSHNANTSNEDLIKRAKKASNDLYQQSVTSLPHKKEIVVIIDELLEQLEMKQQPSTTTTTEAATTTKKATAEAATQTDKPHVKVNETTIKAIDKKHDLIINLLQKDKTYPQAVTTAPRSPT